MSSKEKLKYSDNIMTSKEKLKYSDDVEQIFYKYAISKNEYNDLVKRGLIYEKITSLYLKESKMYPGYYEEYLIPICETIKLLISKHHNEHQKYFYALSNFHLIIYESFSYKKVKDDNGTRVLYDRPNSLMLIPLKKIKRMEIVYKYNKKDIIPHLHKVDVQKEAMNGALFGMAIGGMAGAMIGAETFAKNSHDYVEFYKINQDYYSLEIEFIDGEIIYINNFWVYDPIFLNNDNENRLEKKKQKMNNKIKIILGKAHQNLSEKEMQEIVKKDIGGQLGLKLFIILVILSIGALIIGGMFYFAETFGII